MSFDESKNLSLSSHNQNGSAIKSNRFESLEKFKEFVRQAFIEGSGIDPELFDACVEFHADQEFDYGGEVSTPIHDALGWEFIRFGHQVKEPLYAAFLKNEDGSIWQAVLSIWDEERQRTYQYKAPKKIGDRAFLPPVPPNIRKQIASKHGVEVPETGSFWEWVEDADVPRVLTEGGKKGLCLLSQGYVGIALYGCDCGAKSKDELGSKVEAYLTDDLERFAMPDSKWMFALDRDEKHDAQVKVSRSKTRFRTALGASGCIDEDIVWKSQEGKGVDDLVVNKGSGAFDSAYQKALAKLEKSQKAEERQSNLPTAGARSQTKRLLNFVEGKWGSRLRFNEMSLDPELDGKLIDFDTLSERFGEEFDLDVGKEKAASTILFLSQKRSYHPVREYLERIADLYPEDSCNRLLFDSIAYRYFGTTEPLHNAFMRKHLIGQVRRIFEPGCQHDTAVVLQGKQGLQKSKFWRTLAVNPDWFDDTIASGTNDKDERLKLRRFWILELAEIDGVFKKKEVSSLRAFLTTRSDNLRVPYGRSIKIFPRTSCFVGSVNPSQFLSDPEGHRRYWVIPVECSRIPTDVLEQERDILWAAAVHAYRRDEMHWLTAGQERQNALLNKHFEQEDSWQEVIAHYLESQSEVTVSSILSSCLKIEIGRHERPAQMRVAEILKRLDWEKSNKKQRLGSKNPTPVWKKVSTGSLQGITEVSTKVSQPLNLDTSIVSGTNVDTFLNSQDFPEEKLPISIQDPSADQYIEKGVYNSNENAPQTTQPQGFQECDTSPVTPVTPLIERGTKVKVVMPGSKRDGMTGVVTSLSKGDKGSIARVRLDSQELQGESKYISVAVPGDDNQRLEVLRDE